MLFATPFALRTSLNHKINFLASSSFSLSTVSVSALVSFSSLVVSRSISWSLKLCVSHVSSIFIRIQKFFHNEVNTFLLVHAAILGTEKVCRYHVNWTSLARRNTVNAPISPGGLFNKIDFTPGGLIERGCYSRLGAY